MCMWGFFKKKPCVTMVSNLCKIKTCNLIPQSVNTYLINPKLHNKYTRTLDSLRLMEIYANWIPCLAWISNKLKILDWSICKQTTERRFHGQHIWISLSTIIFQVTSYLVILLRIAYQETSTYIKTGRYYPLEKCVQNYKFARYRVFT